MEEKKNLKKKQGRRLIATLIAVTLILVVSIGIYNRMIIHFVERDMGEVFLKASNHSGHMLQENMEGGFATLHKLAEQLADQDLKDTEIFAKSGFESTRNSWIMITDLDGNTVSPQGPAGQAISVKILQEGLGVDEGISDFQTIGIPGDQTGLVMMVPIKKNEIVKGILSGYFDISNATAMMETPIEGGRQMSYIITKDGRGIMWDVKGENPLGFSNNSSFHDNAFLESHKLVNVLYEEMKGREQGVIRTDDEEGRDVYMFFMPTGFQDWYSVSVAQTDMIAQKASEISRFVWLIGSVITLVILLLVFRIITSYHQKGSTMEREVLFDALTGLPNWKNMLESVKIPSENYGEYACMVLAVNNFKQINTLFGFEEGGRVLKSVAGVFENGMEEGEYACRISGEKFALVFHYDTYEALSARIDALLQKLEVMDVEGNEIAFNYRCTYSGGLFLLKDLKEGQTLIDARDRAALVGGGLDQGAASRWACFDEEAGKELALRKSLENDIVRAFKERQFVPYFQPQYSIATGEIFGAEVLARWNHPQHGVVMPRHFIPVLEHAGCILDLDLCMLEGACRCLKNWIEQGNLPVTITVNISQLNLHRKDFVKQVSLVVDNYQVPPNLLAFEIGDEAITNDMEKMKEVVGELKKRGYKIILDDAGLGHVTVDVFQHLPLDCIKVNKDFILISERGERERKVLVNLMKLARDIGITVIAKFIETKEEVEIISKHGCENAQGRLFAEPMAEPAFVSLLFEQNK